MRARCQNCQEEWLREELVYPIPHLHERVDPGEPVPEGECPDCGALCHAIVFEPDDNKVTSEVHGFAADIRIALRAIGLNKERVNISTFTEDKEWRDYRILIETDKQYEVMPCESERRTIGGTKPTLGWCATEFVYWPGVMHYPDGSGAPPEWNEEDDITSASRKDILDWLVHKIADELVSVAFENKMYDDMEASEHEARVWEDMEAEAGSA